MATLRADVAAALMRGTVAGGATRQVAAAVAAAIVRAFANLDEVGDEDGGAWRCDTWANREVRAEAGRSDVQKAKAGGAAKSGYEAGKARAVSTKGRAGDAGAGHNTAPTDPDEDVGDDGAGGPAGSVSAHQASGAPQRVMAQTLATLPRRRVAAGLATGRDRLRRRKAHDQARTERPPSPTRTSVLTAQVALRGRWRPPCQAARHNRCWRRRWRLGRGGDAKWRGQRRSAASGRGWAGGPQWRGAQGSCPRPRKQKRRPNASAYSLRKSSVWP